MALMQDEIRGVKEWLTNLTVMMGQLMTKVGNTNTAVQIMAPPPSYGEAPAGITAGGGGSHLREIPPSLSVTMPGDGTVAAIHHAE
jgi:hypothetical protein